MRLIQHRARVLDQFLSAVEGERERVLMRLQSPTRAQFWNFRLCYTQWLVKIQYSVSCKHDLVHSKSSYVIIHSRGNSVVTDVQFTHVNSLHPTVHTSNVDYMYCHGFTYSTYIPSSLR